MARPRKTDLHLPARVYFKDGRYRYFSPEKKWHVLGREWDRAAKEEYDRLARDIAAPQTVTALLSAFLAHREKQVRAGKKSARTLADNEKEAKMLRLVFGQMPVAAVTRPHVARYLRKRKNHLNGKLSPVRANREKALLSSAFSWAMGEEGWTIPINPCHGVRRNEETPRKRYITTSELAVWKRTATPRLRAFVLLKRLIGCRQGELLALTIADVTDRGLRCGISKTGRTKIVRWSWALRTTVEVVMALPLPIRGGQWTRRPQPPARFEPTGPLPLFPNATGGKTSAKAFRSAWVRSMRPYLKAGNAGFCENDIRAKTASDLPTDHAQELLDHAGRGITRGTYQRAPVKVRPLR